MKLSEEDLAFIADYDAGMYERPSVTADTVLFRLKAGSGGGNYPRPVLEVLLIRRGQSPYKGGWALPGGFCDMDEPLADCAARELLEETGLGGRYYGQIATYSDVHRDPRTRVIGTSYLAVLPYGTLDEAIGNDDAVEAAWFEVSFQVAPRSGGYDARLSLHKADERIAGTLAIDRCDDGRWMRRVTEESALAFDHLEVVAAGVAALRQRLYRSDLPYAWVPRQFNLRALQGVFEAVLEEDLLRTTFFEHIKHDIKRAAGADEAAGILDQVYEHDEHAFDDAPPFDIWI